MSWLHTWDLWKTRWQWLWKWICTTKMKNACGIGKLGFVILCLNTWPRVSGWNYSKESLRPWKMLCWRHGKDNLKMWLITQMMRRHCSLWNWWHAEFKIDLKLGEDNEKFEVIRCQFPLLHGMLRATYSAQGFDFGWMRAGWFAACWWLGRWWLVANHICYADACPQTSESDSTGLHWARGGSFTQRATFLSSRTEPKVLPRWSACRTGLCMTHCKLPDILLCMWIQPLVGGAVCWNKTWLELSGGLLTCLMPFLHICLTGGILTWFGMFGAENASSGALQCICDLSMCCCCH